MKYIATETFRAKFDGEIITVSRGVDRVDENHELRRRFPDFWEPINETEVEQATAAPGEKRQFMAVRR